MQDGCTCFSWLVTASNLACRLPVIVTMAPLSLKPIAVALPMPADPPAGASQSAGRIAELDASLVCYEMYTSCGHGDVDHRSSIIPVMRTLLPFKLLY